jgi:hypothetical protein
MELSEHIDNPAVVPTGKSLFPGPGLEGELESYSQFGLIGEKKQ